ncbi:YeiH family protein [Phycicoccus ginsengisoli]
MVGGPVIGIVLGVLAHALLGSRPALVPGSRFAATVVLQAAVVILGAGLSMAQVVHTGWGALPVMVGTLTVALVSTALVGRWLGVERETRTLIGVGTGICGASAIATVSAVIGASELAIAYSMTTIFVFNVVAVLVFPALGHAMGLSQAAFGLWAGTAVNDTSSVVAAATVYGSAATSFAVVVKLTRTLMIVPMSVALAMGRHRRERAAAGGARTAVPWRRLVPVFLLLFLVVVALNSFGLVPPGWHSPLSWTARYFTTLALVGVGMGTPFGALRTAGWRPLALGAVLWVAVAASSLALQWATGSL